MPKPLGLHTISDLAAEFGKDRRTIASALKNVKPDGKVGVYDAWHIKTMHQALIDAASGGGEAMNPVREKARFDAVRADKAEVELAALKKEFVPRADIRALLLRVAGTVRTAILALPAKIAPLVRKSMNTAQIEALVRKHVDEALSELSSLERGT